MNFTGKTYTSLATGLKIVLLAGIFMLAGSFRLSPADGCQCANPSFSIRQSGGGAGVGKKAIDFAIRNTGSSECCLQGFPQLQFIDERGIQVSIRVQEAGSTYFTRSVANGPVTIKPGKEAVFQLAFDGAQGSDAGCVPITHIKVKLPGTSTWLETNARFTICGGTANVTPVMSM